MADIPQKPEGIDKIKYAVDKVIAKIDAASNEEEIEKLLEAVKLGVEIQKTAADRDKAERETLKIDSDVQLAKRQATQSLIAAFASLLIPIGSLLTVVFTLSVSFATLDQNRQKAAADEERQAVERQESNWSTFLTEIDSASADSLSSSPTFVSKLMAVHDTHRHDKELADITKRIAINVTSLSAFRGLWELRQTLPHEDELSDLIDAARSKKLQNDQLLRECFEIQIPPDTLPADPKWGRDGPCSPAYSDADLARAFPVDEQLKSIQSMRVRRAENETTQTYLASQIAERIRNASSNTGALELNLSGIMLAGVNLNSVDFSKSDLTLTVLQGDTFAGAKLIPKAMSTDMLGSSWWDAAEIDQSALPILILQTYPENSIAALRPAGADIKFADYAAKVAGLCTSHMEVCQSKCLRFGPSPAPIPAECEGPQ
ncbi:hypothetical protein GFL57_28210 [Rhizobium leguminosarum bv. viciae]|nr:hypothetical protein [Rhizobium leguminosarum bv. viciae]